MTDKDQLIQEIKNLLENKFNQGKETLPVYLNELSLKELEEIKNLYIIF